jgi:ribosomal protein L40E
VISISNLCIGGICNIANSSYTAPIQNGQATAKVTFDVTYSNLPTGSTLFYGVYHATQVNFSPSLYVPGLGSSTPDECTPLGVNETVATCATNPIPDTSVTESVAFQLNFNSTETTYTLQAWAWAAHGTNTFSQFARSDPFEIIVKSSPIVPGVITIFGFQIQLTSLLQTLGGIAISGGGIVVGIYHKNRKRRTLSSYLTKIDSTYNEYALNRTECIRELEKLKQAIIELLNKGKIDESHFEMLDQKIKDYLIDLTQKPEHIAREIVERQQPSTDRIAPSKFCANCGTRLPAEAKICDRCGENQD